ncbi:DUF5675 family protein [Desulfovibrio gilichinskyi]|uniref:DUF5675 domain-containing protein n=1 Tax=Desulfovibrio gilichinskyi TaxID=1519643 RepID=A0A1X7C4A4_9BACT|nr:DUF5675 family protein [Desulfovibrio gilichinskyi]SME89328.1 hypothetical protein SAMN06295933_0277 [Desulfovibrio gilichinskyi]
MPLVELIRVEQTDKATIGVLKVEGQVICWTLEEPWKDNQEDVSCIPAGEYEFKLEHSPSKGRKLWTIKGVPLRSYVRIHIGNTVDDTEGCPLTGSFPGKLNGKRAVLSSTQAFNKFMEAMTGWSDKARIVIKSV